MPLSKKHVEDVCCWGKGHLECRYITVDEILSDRFFCLKKTDRKNNIDKKVKNHIDDCKKKGKDPKADGHPLGDNCPGFIPLKYLKQGYDV